MTPAMTPGTEFKRKTPTTMTPAMTPGTEFKGKTPATMTLELKQYPLFLDPNTAIS